MQIKLVFVLLQLFVCISSALWHGEHNFSDAQDNVFGYNKLDLSEDNV